MECRMGTVAVVQLQQVSCGGSCAGRHQNQPGGNGWSAVGRAFASPPCPSKAGDLTHFGKLLDMSSSAQTTYGPWLAFANKGKQKDAKLLSNQEPVVAVAPNTFAALGGINTNKDGTVDPGTRGVYGYLLHFKLRVHTRTRGSRYPGFFGGYRR
ncbi:hypothetical protein PCANC_23539 [Puccinia coronata f. sp. avenae]|uniref:Uncharacterized protein n=1 Tax=Puccinia coronata f. sp. avenae TaxID=200324 RepID=A0A2N5U637_9BASI|nr:hypothetical protein PCANC_23539 [Puccinia coronata f. sp. avenae]